MAIVPKTPMSYTLFIKCSLYASQEGAVHFAKQNASGLHGGNYPYILQNKILAKQKKGFAYILLCKMFSKTWFLQSKNLEQDILQKQIIFLIKETKEF